MDDSSQFIDWEKRTDIKAQLKVQIILTLSKHGYPPATRDEVFKAIFEQAENFKKNRPVDESIEKMGEVIDSLSEDAKCGTSTININIHNKFEKSVGAVVLPGAGNNIKDINDVINLKEIKE